MRQGRMMMAACVAAAAVGGRAGAQAPASGRMNPMPVEVQMAVSPMEVGKPALRFELLPPERDVEVGNAATRYLMALPLLPRTANEDTSMIDGWLKCPLAELDEKAAQAKVDEAGSALHITAAAARTSEAAWGVDMRREGIRAMIPQLSPLREVSALLALSIRMHIKKHQWMDARDGLETGFAMARHLGEGDTLVESLVGIGVAGQMEACLEDWVKEAGSPNLFWPLCNVPVPFNDLRHPLAMERSWLFYQWPALRDMAAGRYSVERWYALMDGCLDVKRMTTGQVEGPSVGLGLLMAVGDYPQAKAALIAEGAKAEEVEERPVAAVLEEYFLKRYEENADEVSKWDGVRADQAIAAWQAKRVERGFFTGPPQNFADIVSRQIIPALGTARFRAARLDRHLAMLRIVEALRAYAAEKGAFPEALTAMELPLQLTDAATGQAFGYAREGEGAMLSSPAGTDPARQDRWRVTLRR